MMMNLQRVRWRPVGIDSLLETASNGRIRNCNLWQFHVDFISLHQRLPFGWNAVKLWKKAVNELYSVKQSSRLTLWLPNGRLKEVAPVVPKAK